MSPKINFADNDDTANITSIYLKLSWRPDCVASVARYSQCVANIIASPTVV